jgi:hypothetical protein
MEDWALWRQILAIIVLLAVTGWANEMRREAKRSADALEKIVDHLHMDHMDRTDHDPPYPGQ